MKALKIFLSFFALLVCITAGAQTNYSLNLPAGQEVRNMYGLICCTYKINVATDDAGNAYVLSEQTSDSSMWVTKYDFNGNQVYNVRVGVLGYETDYHYAAKKIKVYDRVYILSRTLGPLNNPNYHEGETVYTMDKNTGVVDQPVANFIPYFGHTSCELIDLVASGNTINMIGETYSGSGPGSAKVHVMRSDLTWTGNSYLLGNNASTDYLLNTESSCLTYLNGAVYMTGQTSSSSGNNIFIMKLDVWGFYSEYVYTNNQYTSGGKGLRIAADGNAVYVAGALKQTNKPFKTTVIKIDSALTAPIWVNINKNSEWPLGLEVSNTDVIYTVDFKLKVVGFSKATGNQLFAKNDFSRNAQVYNQPVNTALLNNNQLLVQASLGVVLGHGMGAVNTNNKVLFKYSTSGNKVYQQMESLAIVSPGNPGYAEALGIAYSSATDYTHEIFRKYSSAGELVYVQGRSASSALRPIAEEENLQQLSVFPNPARESFKITSAQRIVHWVMYDSVMRQMVSNEVNGYQVDADCSHLQDGIYFLTIVAEDGKTVTQKIIINK
jgi:hypothetical protein